MVFRHTVANKSKVSQKFRKDFLVVGKGLQPLVYSYDGLTSLHPNRFTKSQIFGGGWKRQRPLYVNKVSIFDYDL